MTESFVFQGRRKGSRLPLSLRLPPGSVYRVPRPTTRVSQSAVRAILKEWSRTVVTAQMRLGAALAAANGGIVNPRELLGSHADVVALITGLASLADNGRDLEPFEVEMVARMLSVQRPPTGRNLVLTILCAEYAPLYRGQTTDGAKVEIAERFIYDLFGRVDQQFGRLMGRFEDFRALLDRYEQPGKLGKLHATGLAKAINELAGSPLGDFSPRAISEAKRRRKKK